MTTRHDLPSGGWITLRDVDELRARDKRAVQKAWAKDDPEHPLSNLLDVSDHIAKVVASEIFLPYSVESNVNSDWVSELKLADSTEVERLIVPLSRAMFPLVDANEHTEDPDSPTTPESV